MKFFWAGVNRVHTEKRVTSIGQFKEKTKQNKQKLE